MDIHFYHQFKNSIEDGTKIQTFRQSNRSITVGGTVNLVIYPYTKKRRVLRSVVIYSVIPIEIDAESKSIKLHGRYLNLEGIRVFSKNEGFNSVDDMWVYISKHERSSKAVLLMWGFCNYQKYFKPIVVSYNDINNK